MKILTGILLENRSFEHDKPGKACMQEMAIWNPSMKHAWKIFRETPIASSGTGICIIV
jgi:hypothetical protein